MNRAHITYSDGDQCWYKDNNLHREDGPAFIRHNGDKDWYLNGDRHRTDGPACEHVDGYKSWWVHGDRHRIDGPAIINPETGYTAWFLLDIEYDPVEWLLKVHELGLK
jgi:hypothetical protein